MSKLTDDIEKLADIGRQLVQFGYEEYGRGWENLEDNMRVYTATTGNHTAFGIDGFQISYFRPIKFEGEIKHINEMSKYVVRAQAELDRIQEYKDSRGASELEHKKQERIAILKQELSKLEANTKPNNAVKPPIKDKD